MQKIRRALIVLLVIIAALLALAAFALRVPAVAAVVRRLPIGPSLGPTAPAPVIAAPAGPLPAGPAGLTELAQYGAQSPRVVGSGFMLLLPGGPVIGVTTAHSVPDLGQLGNALQNLGLALPGSVTNTVSLHIAHFEFLFGQPGVAFRTGDLSVDYVLLQSPGPDNPALTQAPDPRGGPQPGERVALYSGLGNADGTVRVLLGTVMSSTPAADWVLMDDQFDPNGMSGSPVLSAYTGQVVGMAVATTQIQERLLIGLNPIGRIVAHALAATDYPAIAGYKR